jgi:guanylate kinase
MNKRFVVLSGPSCAGKGPLQAAVDRFYPGLLAARPVLCHSRLPRAGEVHGKDYYFQPPALIKQLRQNPDFAVAQVRTDWQAIDLLQIEDLLQGHDLVFAEVFHAFGKILQDRAAGRDFTLCSIFLLPVCPDAGEAVIVETMREKLRNRGTDKEPKLSERARSAPFEMANSSAFTYRILNPAGEDEIEEWGEFGTRNGQKGARKINSLDDLGPNSRWLVEIFAKIFKGEVPPLAPTEYFSV